MGRTLLVSKMYISAPAMVASLEAAAWEPFRLLKKSHAWIIFQTRSSLNYVRQTEDKPMLLLAFAAMAAATATGLVFRELI